MRTQLLSAACFLMPVAASIGCGDDAAPRSAFPYRPDETVVIGGDGATAQNTPSGDECLELANGECVKPQGECGEGTYADVLLDGDGDVNEIVCLPVEQDIGLVYVDDGNAVLPDNGAVVILDDADLHADITVEGNRGVIYGDSPIESVIHGNLTLRGNESIVRGVTVTGDVTFDGNTAEFYYCVVHGDVILKGNENLISNCTIFGSIIGSGNGDRVLSSFVAGRVELGGEPDECLDNSSFEDTDADLVLDEAEIEAAQPLACE